MGKLYSVIILNIITNKEYKITSFGNCVQEVHKHVLFKVLSRNENIESILYNDECMFDDTTGFFTEKL